MPTKVYRKLIEVDVDGVLLDPYTPAEKWLSAKGYDITFEKCTSYSLKELGELSKPAKTALIHPVVRSNSKPYQGAAKFLRQLAAMANEFYWDVVLHSSEFVIECVPIKNRLIDELIEGTPIHKHIELGPKHMLKDSFICVEDCLDNLHSSDAPIKICRKQFHNTAGYTDSDISLYTASYDEMLDCILEVFKKVN